MIFLMLCKAHFSMGLQNGREDDRSDGGMGPLFSQYTGKYK